MTPAAGGTGQDEHSLLPHHHPTQHSPVQEDKGYKTIWREGTTHSPMQLGSSESLHGRPELFNYLNSHSLTLNL